MRFTENVHCAAAQHKSHMGCMQSAEGCPPDDVMLYRWPYDKQHGMI